MQLKTLGLIGGTSWHSTIVYYRLINELAAEQMGSRGNPPLLLYSQNIELMRSRDWEQINTTYLQTAKRLEAAGAEAIMICANTPHVVYEHVSSRIGIPILHITDATADSAKKKGLSTLGLLGNKPTMEKDFIKGRLAKEHDIRAIVPEEEARTRSNRIISAELTRGKFTEDARQFFLGEMKKLQDRGAEGIILGCTELPMLIKQEDFGLPLFDTTRLHAEMGVEFIFS